MHIIMTAVGALVELALMVLVVAALGVAAAAGYAIISAAAEIAREKIGRRRKQKTQGGNQQCNGSDKATRGY